MKHCFQFLLTILTHFNFNSILTFLAAILSPKRNLKQSAYATFLGDKQKSIMVCYGIFCSGQ